MTYAKELLVVQISEFIINNILYMAALRKSWQTNYYSENTEFSRDRADLELLDETKNYVYDVPDKISFFTIPSDLSIIIGKPKDNQLRYAVGVIYTENDGTSSQRVCKAYKEKLFLLVFMLLQDKWDEADAKYCGGQ